MGKVTLAMFMSLDGYIEGPGGAFAGPPYSPDLQTRWIDENMRRAAMSFYGRVCYEFMASFWTSPAAPAEQAAELAAKPKAVFSRTLREATWANTEIVRDDIPGAVARFKRDIDGEIMMFGGAEIAGVFVDLDLFDEYRLMVMPVLLGGGKRLFAGPHIGRSLRLEDATPFDSGVVLLTYVPEPKRT